MFVEPTFADLNLGVTLPAVWLLVAACILLMVDLFLPDERKSLTPYLAMGSLVISFILNLFTYNPEQTTALNEMFKADAFTGFLNIVLLIAAFISILLSTDYLKRTKINKGEYYVLLLLSTAGAMFMVGANDLIIVFIALELLSIPLYILAAFRSLNKEQVDMASKSEESGMKYFILGAFSSAFLVYGSALVYGATGTTNIPAIFESVSVIISTTEPTSSPFFLLAGAGLLLVGLGFKVAVVPFHMWTPDVYEGAPTPVTAFMSVVAKVGGFASLLRVMVTGLATFTLVDGDPAAWQTTITIVAIATLILGNFVAIAQRNIKRLLAYSSIAHAGYIIMAVAAAGTAGVENSATQGALVYLLAYMFTNLGAFAVAMAIEKDDGTGVDLDDLKGLAKSNPMLAMAMAVFMLSLTGIPLTAGFVGKLLIFQATVNAGLIGLAVIGVLTSVVSAFYYVRVIVNMYLDVDAEGDPAAGATPYLQWAVNVSLAGTMILGIIFPLATNLVSMVQIV